ncbi:MAG: hypothetical protein K2N51_14590 [Lachnospiraceae bacterium]|nr:hypothetical protein [Lachnospiraceae bacterium]
MKRLNITLIVLALLMSCGKNAEKDSLEEEVRNYGKYFIEKLANGQIDSLKFTYPEIIMADSLSQIIEDSIRITEISSGKYKVVLSDNVSLTVNRSDDGKITISESTGLFAFPLDKLEIAKKTGMLDSTLNDKQIAERLNDEGFFKYLDSLNKKKTTKLLTVTEFKTDAPSMGTASEEGWQTIINNTDVPFDGSEYSIIFEEGGFWYYEDTGVESKTYKKKGNPIPARGSIKINTTAGYHYYSLVKDIKINLTPDQIRKRFMKYTGTEYSDYLASESKLNK